MAPAISIGTAWVRSVPTRIDGRSSGYSRGVTLTEFARIFESLGCTQAYNLDGGGSSTLYFQGRVVNNPLGRSQERGVSDILYISEEQAP